MKKQKISYYPKLIVRSTSVGEEYSLLVYNLKSLPKLRQMGQKIFLPEHPLIMSLTKEEADLSVLSLPETKEIFEKEIYPIISHKVGLDKGEITQDFYHQIIDRFYYLNSLWGFHIAGKYEVLLTGLGVGGSYDATHEIIVYSTKNIKSLPLTFVHEAVHIGIEKDIVIKFNLTQQEKERVVDTICINIFSALLPDYTYGKTGDVRIDEFITSETINNLPKTIEDYVKKYPRENRNSFRI